MKNILTITNILTWFNLIIGGILAFLALIAIVSMPPFVVFFLIVVIGSIILHNYAAIQLRKSIVNPDIPLNSQTPTGIRVMGYIAMFFGIMMFSNAIYILQNTDELLKQVQVPKEQLSQVNLKSIFRGSAFFVILFGLSIVLNVILNLRLLKWYVMNNNNNSSGQ